MSDDKHLTLAITMIHRTILRVVIYFRQRKWEHNIITFPERDVLGKSFSVSGKVSGKA